MNVLGPYPSSPEAFDVLNGDVKPEDLPGRISQALGIQYLAALETRSNPVKGIMFNTTGNTLPFSHAPCVCGGPEFGNTFYI